MSSNKVSHDDDHLDFKKLEVEVQTAVVNEERYWRENDAKIRAVEQRVPTYDDFREMVLAAHLKPLEKGDKMNNIKIFTQVWNQPAKKCSKSDVHENSINTENISKPCKPTLNSGQKFVQYWKCCKNADEKKHFLLSLDGPKLLNIFKVEIAGGLLGEFIQCFQNFDEAEAILIVNCLEILSKSQRFSLSKTFLSSKEKDLCTQLFNKLSQENNISDDAMFLQRFNELKNIYC
ncbi:hypothetical protein Btru_008333 [Bulinus truncatus]|nr:hypothetical protein Btru_008333 [Bulinus truncatus]